MVDPTSSSKSKVNLREIFLGLQKQMIEKLKSSQSNIHHPTTKGNVSEVSWLNMLNEYLPNRYAVKNAFVIDSRGELSEQIDIVLFDRQYSPFLFNQDGAIYVPAESVYAVFEVKPSLNKETIEYAGGKASSVRRLFRTSAAIPYAGGVYPPKQLHEIMAGILTLDCDWNPPFDDTFRNTVNALPYVERIELGCALLKGGFQIKYLDHAGHKVITTGSSEVALIYFFLNLMQRLQEVGTVPAIDIVEYFKSLQ